MLWFFPYSISFNLFYTCRLRTLHHLTAKESDAQKCEPITQDHEISKWQAEAGYEERRKGQGLPSLPLCIAALFPLQIKRGADVETLSDPVPHLGFNKGLCSSHLKGKFQFLTN